MDLRIFTSIAYAALALLITVLAIYLSLKLLGKIAKFVIIGVVVAAVLWFLFSDHSVLQLIGSLGDKLPTFSDLIGKVG